MSNKDFFRQVWNFVATVPKGKVVTYGQIAFILDNPCAARTVGWALHSTPKEMDIPWHRVINSKGGISTGSEEHEPNLQRILLQEEGVVFSASGSVDLSRYQWIPDESDLNQISE